MMKSLLLTTTLMTGLLMGTAHADDHRGHTHVELKGTLERLDTSAETFRLGGILVQYGQARELDLNGQSLRNGALVEVEGRVDNGVVKASEVELERTRR